jgi:hypothetical protein
VWYRIGTMEVQKKQEAWQQGWVPFCVLITAGKLPPPTSAACVPLTIRDPNALPLQLRTLAATSNPYMGHRTGELMPHHADDIEVRPGDVLGLLPTESKVGTSTYLCVITNANCLANRLSGRAQAPMDPSLQKC